MITIEVIKKIADKNGYDVSVNAPDIIERINLRDGQCPCRIDGTRCPCPYLAEDIKILGRCHCGLFVVKRK